MMLVFKPLEAARRRCRWTDGLTTGLEEDYLLDDSLAHVDTVCKSLQNIASLTSFLHQ